jgi:hypothetical protein
MKCARHIHRFSQIFPDFHRLRVPISNAFVPAARHNSSGLIVRFFRLVNFLALTASEWIEARTAGLHSL